MREVYTIGHGALHWYRFTGLLNTHRITRLVDVRTYAVCRWAQFNIGFLKRHLGAGYSHAPILGGAKCFDLPAVRRALKQVLDSANGDRICLMCSCGDYRLCHRYTLLTPLLVELGWRVLEIRHRGALVENCGPVLKSLRYPDRSRVLSSNKFRATNLLSEMGSNSS
jgi:uncharacterized protein (DUF488 family)